MSKNYYGMSRRDFCRVTGAGTLALLASRLPGMAGQVVNADFGKLVPADKKLDPDWVRSLFARGEPQVFRGKELEYIGMPVGGICAGLLYLGGDGKLWGWDIFNHPASLSCDHYAHPIKPASPIEQGFRVRVGDKVVDLDRSGFADIRFQGQYPIAKVDYRDPAVPVEVGLEAFSPFIPLNTADSSLPATVMRFTLKNPSDTTLEVELSGRMENAVCLYNRDVAGMRRNRIIQGKGYSFLECSAERLSDEASKRSQDVVFEDWNKATYDGWKVEGNAFGSGPIPKSAIPQYQGDVGGDTERVVNSHASAPEGGLEGKDRATGRLTSRDFTIEHAFIGFWIGGGSKKGQTGLHLVVDGKRVCSACGLNDNRMRLNSFDTAPFRGKKAFIEIVDDSSEGWGHVGVGRITFSNARPGGAVLEQCPDYGSMGLALVGAPADRVSREASVPIKEKLVGEICRSCTLKPGGSVVVTFVVAWHFPNLEHRNVRVKGNHYATKFDSALAVARYVAENITRLTEQTHLWRDTWYDSTLPYWFLDRTFINTSSLATTTSFRFTNGRFYGLEGVGSDVGTCTSVWYYAQAIARLFPDLERSAREMQDFADGIGFDPASGGIFTRGESRGDFVLDGQAGNVLRAYREHQMSADSEFLKRNWAKTRKALDWLIREDGNNDGIIEGHQSTTLDTGSWWGAMSWTSSLYLAALRAGTAMAEEMGDRDYAERTRKIADVGGKNIVERLWNGEYFIHLPDRSRPKSFVIGNGCHIDQVYGQAWTAQVGLERVLPARHTRSALQAIWKYNFTPDVGPYRAKYPAGRWYAMPGEGGVIMTTWPTGERENPKEIDGGMMIGVGYLNECMSGFEHQVAGHMIGEGLVMEGLAVERTIHDRYHASRRNPWNEVEFGDHYARAMASYGVFLEACGFEYHGPKAHIGFAPRLTPGNFKAAFTSAEGWGAFSQSKNGKTQSARIEVKYGKLRVKTISLAASTASKVMVGGQPAEFRQQTKDGKILVTLAKEATLSAGEAVEVVS